MYKKFIDNKRAAFFDLDGTIVDSLPLWESSFIKVLNTLEMDITIASNIYYGYSLKQLWRIALGESSEKMKIKVSDLVELTNIEYLKNLQSREIEPRPGFTSVLHDLKVNKKFLTCITSNSNRVVVNNTLKKLDLEGVFDLEITGDDVKKPKPDPEIYNLARTKLKLKIEEILVFEDSITGATSAKKAGMSMVIIWDGNVRDKDYPKTVLEFFPDFLGLVGNLDEDYVSYIKNHTLTTN